MNKYPKGCAYLAKTSNLLGESVVAQLEFACSMIPESSLMLSTRGLFEPPQLLQSFHIAVFRCCLKQNPGLYAISWDAVTLQIKLCKRQLCRIIARPQCSPELSCKSVAVS